MLAVAIPLVVIGVATRGWFSMLLLIVGGIIAARAAISFWNDV